MLRSIFLQALLSCHGYQNTHCAQHEIDTASFYSVPCSHHHTVHLLERKHMLQTAHSNTLSHIRTSRDDMDCQGVAIVLAIPELCTKLFRVYKPEAVLQSEAAERRRLLIRLKAKLQLGEEKEGGNTSARSAQTMQHSPVAIFGNEAIVRSIVHLIYRFPGVLFNVYIRVFYVLVITL